MEKDLIRVFQKAKKDNQYLAENVWHNITIRNKRISHLKLWIFSLIGFVSLIGLIPAWKTLLNDLSQSGIYDYLSVAFSNGFSIPSYWRELSLSIVEALPTMSIILSLSLLFTLLISLKYTIKQIVKNQLYITKLSTLTF